MNFISNSPFILLWYEIIPQALVTTVATKSPKPTEAPATTAATKSSEPTQTTKT